MAARALIHCACYQSSWHIYIDLLAVILPAGNRWDSYYPVWARAEHRWYPTGRFAAYNQYVKENIGQLTMKYAPGVSTESSM
jgi:hypothetical protein